MAPQVGMRVSCDTGGGSALARTADAENGGIEMTIHGGCLCGKVRYRIDGPLLDADNCHCSMCRRQHGAAFATYADFDPKHFRWICGEALVRVYETPAGAGWCFCSECGSSLAGTEHGVVDSIALGTVEGDPGIRPQAHIFAGSGADWYEITDDLPRFEERPPAAAGPRGKDRR